MMNHKTNRVIFSGTLKNLLLPFLVLATTATTQAQQSTSQVPSTTQSASKPAEGKQVVERIEVVGSRIKRIQKEGTAPVVSVGKEGMKNSANTTASDSLRDSTLATYGVARERAGTSAAATTTIGLRGLGDTRTLVLLNGIKLPKDPSFEAVDLNLIPQNAIERIEVLKDGASALYGSDALGGVVNIITKKGYKGNEASMKFSTPELKGGAAFDVSALSGFSDESLDFLASLNYSHSDKIFGKDRSVIKNAKSTNGVAAAWTPDPAATPFTLANPADCPADLKSANNRRCSYRYNELASKRPQINQVNLFTDLNYRINSGLKLYNRNLVVYKNIGWNYAPAPFTAADEINGTASQPTAKAIKYRSLKLGNRDNDDNEFNFNTIVGVKGNLTSLWDYDLNVGYGEINRTTNGVNGYILRQKAVELMQNGTFDPLAPGGETGSLADAEVILKDVSKTKLLTTDLVVTGELFEIEDRSVGIATGVSYNNDKLEQNTNFNPKDVIGGSGSNDNGTRNVYSAFAEVAVPVTQSFEVDAAARVDKYSDFGTTINPKLSVKYNIDSESLVRASAGTGFKAPTLSQLYSARSSGAQQFIDRKYCQTGLATDPNACDTGEFTVTSGGNKDLKEETSIAYSLGAVIQPISNFSFSLDGWYTRVKNVVAINYEEMTAAEARGINLADYGINIVRNSTDGTIVSVDAPNLNLGSNEISGVDFNFELVLPMKLFEMQTSLENSFSYVLFDRNQSFPGADFRNTVGEYGSPQWRNTATLSLKSDILSYGLTLRSIPGQNVQDRTIDRKISDLNEWDINGSYKISKNIQLAGGVKNLFDADQPLDINGNGPGDNDINDSLYDINGRKYFISFTQKF